MFFNVAIPPSLVEALRRRGLDVGYLIDTLLINSSIDPPEAVKAHAELATMAFNEGVEFANKGDVVQASEKLYKAVEEAIKALAMAKNLEEAREALSKGRWTVALLDNAVSKLGDVVERAWDAAYFLHVNGFHEVRINIEQVRRRIPYIRSLIDELRDEVKVQ